MCVSETQQGMAVALHGDVAALNSVRVFNSRRILEGGRAVWRATFEWQQEGANALGGHRDPQALVAIEAAVSGQ